jgi:hypothetical protein
MSVRPWWQDLDAGSANRQIIRGWMLSSTRSMLDTFIPSAQSEFEDAVHLSRMILGVRSRNSFRVLKVDGCDRLVPFLAKLPNAYKFAIEIHRVCYNELGDLYLDKLNKPHLTRNLIHRLERLGYTVRLEPKAV